MIMDYLGMIVSNKFLRANYGKPLREFLRKNANLDRIVDLAGLPVFPGATVRSIVLLTSQTVAESCPILYSPPLSLEKFYDVSNGLISLEGAIQEETYKFKIAELEQPVWSFSRKQLGDILKRLNNTYTRLEKYCDVVIGYGIKSGFDEAFVIDEETRNNIIRKDKNSVEIIKPYLNGRDIRRYYLESKKIYIIYNPRGIDLEKYPFIKEHLMPFKERLQKRATKQEWFELQQSQFKYTPYFDGPKIIFPDIAVKPRFSLDEIGFYGSTTTFFVSRNDLYLLGLLNSKLGFLYFAETCAALEGKNEKYLRFKRQYVGGFPVRTIDFSDPADVARHDLMVSLVEQMLALHKQLPEARTPHEQTALQRQIEATDREIDALVYELYGLTEEEIRIVEAESK